MSIAESEVLAPSVEGEGVVEDIEPKRIVECVLLSQTLDSVASRTNEGIVRSHHLGEVGEGGGVREGERE